MANKNGVSWSLIAPSVGLAAMTIAIGICAEPLIVVSQSAADQLLDPKQYIDAVGAGTQPALTRISDAGRLTAQQLNESR